MSPQISISSVTTAGVFGAVILSTPFLSATDATVLTLLQAQDRFVGPHITAGTEATLASLTSLKTGGYKLLDTAAVFAPRRNTSNREDLVLRRAALRSGKLIAQGRFVAT